MENYVNEFQGEFRFLSNFERGAKLIDGFGGAAGFYFQTVEHAYQAAKSLHTPDWSKIQMLKTPAEAKRYGKKIKIRPDWETIKIQVMDYLVRQKFQDPVMAIKLSRIKYGRIEEGNSWGDTFWGVDKWTKQGSNNLGIILMKIRDELVESAGNDPFQDKVHWEQRAYNLASFVYDMGTGGDTETAFEYLQDCGYCNDDGFWVAKEIDDGRWF